MNAAAEPVLLARRDAVAVLTLNAPDRRNALTGPLREALHDRLASAMADETVRAIVMTGAAGTFCAGGDVAAMEPGAALQGRARVERLQRIVRLLVGGPKVVIAAVEGHAAGAGLGLAAACDVVVAAHSARFTSAFGRIGLMPDMGALWTLPWRIGLGATRRLVFCGETLDGTEAARIGLADFTCDPGAALETALDRARAIAAGPSAAFALAKTMLARHPVALDAFLPSEADGQGLLFASEDFAEGRTAFLEKRTPVFKGR
ncbi:enoyl-CoA hydratase/isomerase family protein [Aquabacter spiritensis]|uniref:Enoyl-CoA hydratase/carnithine racemase n=1 Tax=Aquabacter spiritensis TaxID=933073 RepID=A0A4R3LXT6_9HYPH|nr:enoyl-CoA hydratase-related protein [Aquabacter spiritensis]TCT05470.1 enoyl-CoA hydratase/carnithine racemase [Aquabacter spiritensis]